MAFYSTVYWLVCPRIDSDAVVLSGYCVVVVDFVAAVVVVLQRVPMDRYSIGMRLMMMMSLLHYCSSIVVVVVESLVVVVAAIGCWYY